MTKPMNKIKKLWEDKTGVSPIIAVILMVAITVVLAATIYVWVSGFGGGGSESISMAVSQEAAINATGAVTMRVDSASQGANWTNLEYKKTGENYGTFTATDIVEAGDTFDLTGVTAGDVLTIRDKTANSIVLTKTLY